MHRLLKSWLSVASVAILGVVPLTTKPVQAQYAAGIRSVLASQAKGNYGTIPALSVWPGAGMNISFIPLNERILKVWLDDPSRIALDFDVPLCVGGPGGSLDGNCSAPDAMVVHLKQVKGITFPNLPQAESTLLTVVTVNSRNQRNLYHFNVAAVPGAPDYSALVIAPDGGFQDSTKITIRDGRQVGVEWVRKGLQQAQIKGKIGPAQGNQALFGRVLNFVALAQNGMDLSEAASRSGVSLGLVTRLAEMGIDANAISSPVRSTPTQVFDALPGSNSNVETITVPTPPSS